MSGQTITVIGGGLAGCEAAWYAARTGCSVRLYEMRPRRQTEAHQTDHLAELVCSNSFRNASLETAVGLLKEEMRRLGSLVMRVADETAIPAGAALAVDREQFALGVSAAISHEPGISVIREELEDHPCRRRHRGNRAVDLAATVAVFTGAARPTASLFL